MLFINVVYDFVAYRARAGRRELLVKSIGDLLGIRRACQQEQGRSVPYGCGKEMRKFGGFLRSMLLKTEDGCVASDGRAATA